MPDLPDHSQGLTVERMLDSDNHSLTLAAAYFSQVKRFRTDNLD